MSYLTVDELHIASPCTARWADMEGTDTVRSCNACSQNVYNLSLMTRAEGNALIHEKEGKLCVSLYRRFDGTLLTADCPKGLRTIWKQYLHARVKVVASLFAMIGFLGLAASGCSSSHPMQEMGAPPLPDTTHHG